MHEKRCGQTIPPIFSFDFTIQCQVSQKRHTETTVLNRRYTMFCWSLPKKFSISLYFFLIRSIIWSLLFSLLLIVKRKTIVISVYDFPFSFSSSSCKIININIFWKRKKPLWGDCIDNGPRALLSVGFVKFIFSYSSFVLALLYFSKPLYFIFPSGLSLK